MIHTDFLKLTSFLFLLFSKIEAQAQPSNNQLWKRDIQVSIGYPILNTFKTSNVQSQLKNSDRFDSKKYPILELQYSHRLLNELKYSIGFSYFQNKVIGSDYLLAASPGNTSGLYYNLYQIIKITDLRITIAISKDIYLVQSKMLRSAIGFGCHIYPQNNGDSELEVSNYYSQSQDPAISYFPVLAKNKYSYRHATPFSLPNPFIKVEYYKKSNSRVSLFIGLVFTYIFIPEDSDTNIYSVFENSYSRDYAINYNFKNQMILGINLGVNYHGKSVKPLGPSVQ